MAETSRWPLLMDQTTACRYLTFTRAKFNALLSAGLLPPARELIPNEPRWHKTELEKATARLYNLEMTAEHDRTERETEELFRNFTPPAVRDRGKGRVR